jgi:hypothetical protein
VPETPEQFWARVHDGLRVPPVGDWSTWPFEGELHARELAPPVDAEAPRAGEGGVECDTCAAGLEGALWWDDHWQVRTLREPGGLPMVAFLETRDHHDFGDLPAELAVELGPMLLRVQRAVFAIGGIGNVHVCRWGDGGAHFHVWFMARPARIPQLLGSFAAIWDDMLPPLPDDVWQANTEILRRALAGV